MFVIKKKRNIYLIILILIIPILFIYYQKANNTNKYIHVYDVVKEAFLTDGGYSDELSKHISKEVFEYINIYNTYPVNDPEYKKPFKVDFKLRENSQKKINNIVYVKMNYSVEIKDSQNKSIGGSWDVPITLTVKVTGDSWYIIEEEESA
ncbi:hypothetical protein VT96_0211160 [Clostridium sporogenes]|nr:hypothetical protein T258_3556 [Clostridium botulinum Prevot_594]KRU41393.1 hypothetical protein VT94_18580 [Clostridium sporogenes]OQP94066.1 hypothetical protein VT93_0221370 [Clostridium sporogenes]OQP98342.1 hypothetical protein VT96_0211160 [Clostridium sporogenes]SQB32373.1 Uncharacterised protein [Clostridium sporogenes]